MTESFFLTSIEQIEKILSSNLPSCDPRYDCTQLKVKFFVQNGDFGKALEMIDEHINEIMNQGPVDIEDKKNFLLLLKLKAKILFEEEEYGMAQVVLTNALNVCAEYMFDPAQLYAELASALYANGQEDETLFDTINETIGSLENGHTALYRSPYLKTMDCGTRYEDDYSTTFFIKLKTKRPNMKHYYGVCYFGHTSEEIELEPVIRKLELNENSRMITFEKEIPIPDAGLCTEIHIHIYADKTQTTLLGSHFQLLHVFAKSKSGSDFQEYFGI